MENLLIQEWFEMSELKRKDYNKSVWVPLRASRDILKHGVANYVGHKEEFYGVGSIAIPEDKIEDAKQLEWMEVGISRSHTGYADEDIYYSADQYRPHQFEWSGLNLALNQEIEDNGPAVWHLHQDLVVTLGLRREGNSWIRPKDGYVEVARLNLDADEKPELLEIKAEYLKDYLCARGMALYLSCFHTRHTVTENASTIKWSEAETKYNSDGLRWEGYVTPIHEGRGSRYGAKCAVFHTSRTDVHGDEDIPDLSAIPTNDNTAGSSYEKGFEGRKVYRVTGNLWRSSVIYPAKSSPKVRHDEEPNPPNFAIDHDGNTCAGREMVESGKWLWFKPEVITALLKIKGSELKFYTKQTGGITCCHGSATHFGVNDLGLLNIFAKDIAMLDVWQQRVWAGFNVSPDGGVSSELLSAQVKGVPAHTLAGESFFARGLKLVEEEAKRSLNIDIIINHEYAAEIVPKIHRFRVCDDATLRELAKDIARLTADSFSAKQMQQIVSPSKGETWGSLKSLENLLSEKFDNKAVRECLAPLVGIYELRLGDAHLPKSNIAEAYDLIGIDHNASFTHQGESLISNATTALHGIHEALTKWNDK